MAAGEKKYCVLVASANTKLRDFLAQILPVGDYEVLPNAGSAGEARRRFVSTRCNILVVNTPLPDEFGVELAVDFADRPIGILLLTEIQNYDQISHKAEEFGILTQAKPLSRQQAYASIKLLSALTNRLAKMEKAYKNLQEKVNDLRVVDRAKWLLIEKEGLTEEEAHRKIEKYAMDYRTSRRRAAEDIIREYEDEM